VPRDAGGVDEAAAANAANGARVTVVCTLHAHSFFVAGHSYGISLESAPLVGTNGSFAAVPSTGWTALPYIGASNVLIAVSPLSPAAAVPRRSLLAPSGGSEASGSGGGNESCAAAGDDLVSAGPQQCDACGSCGGASGCVGCDRVSPFSDVDCAGRCVALAPPSSSPDGDDVFDAAVGSGAFRLDFYGVCCDSVNGTDCLGDCGGLAEEGWDVTGQFLVCCFAVDCAGFCFGAATVDGCGLCSGGHSGHVADSDKDCAGVCFGTGTCAPTPVSAPTAEKGEEHVGRVATGRGFV
jgi:hypothetical protein